MKKILVIGSLSILSLFLLSCATLFAPSSDEITITSKPEGATVLIDGIAVGTTPLKQLIDRDTFKQKIVSLSKEGYELKEFRLVRTLESKAIFNLTFITSWATDALTGNMIEYSPKAYYIELEKKGKTSSINNGIDEPLRYALVNHAALIEDIAKGDGVYLEAYLEKNLIPPAQRPTIKTLLKSNLASLSAVSYAYRFHLNCLQLIASKSISISKI